MDFSPLNTLIEYGYIGLFLAAFLSATILPLNSEFVLTYLLLHNYDPYSTVAVATTGNVLGSVVNYALGFGGSVLLLKKVLRISSEDLRRAEERFKKYGIFSLFFAWVPIVGDPLTIAAGVLKINFTIFLSLVTLGKLLRYIVIAVSVLPLR